MKPIIDIGFAVRTIRIAKGMTQRQVASGAKVPRTYLAKVEMNRVQPRPPAIKKMAQGLSVAPRTIVAFAEGKKAA